MALFTISQPLNAPLVLAILLTTVFAAADVNVLFADARSTTSRLLLARNSAFQASFLNPHNAARQQVGVPPLVWSTSLAAYAQSYALSQVNHCTPLKHSNGPYGENLFWGWGKTWTPQDAVGDWVAEKQYYHYSSNTCTSGQMCGHYTQVVWATTKSVGCASVICNSGATYIICSYDPPGNWIGRRPY